MYIQVNEKAPLEQQIKQLKNNLEMILDNIETGSSLTFEQLTDEQKAMLRGEDGADAPVDTPVADIYIDAIIV